MLVYPFKMLYDKKYKNYLLPNGKEQGVIMINYAPFWNTLKRKGISQYWLISNHDLSSATLDSLRKNKDITLNTLHHICWMLDCDISDAVEFVPENGTPTLIDKTIVADTKQNRMALAKTQSFENADSPRRAGKLYECYEPKMRPEPTISYAPFWDTLKKSGISQYQLIHTYKISSATLNSIRKNRNLTLNTIEKLCQILNCRISDAVNFS